MTRLQKRGNGLVPPAMADPLVKQGQTSVEYSNVVPSENGRKMFFSELGLPGVESVPTPCGSILHTSVGPTRPKTAKIKMFDDLGVPPYPTLVNRVRGRPNRAITLVGSWLLKGVLSLY